MKKGTYSHPCVREGGYVCMGDLVRVGVNNYRKENQLVSLIYLLLNFLKEPNYGTPYRSAIDFRCAQPVTYKPKDILNYLSDSNWRRHEKWSDKLFYEDLIANYEKDITKLNQEIVDYEDQQPVANYIATLQSGLSEAQRYYDENYDNNGEEESNLA